MNWTKELPTSEGWYFWKRNFNRQPWLWQAIFVLKEKDESSYWDSGTSIHAPKGGWWGKIELSKEEKKS